MQPGRERVLAAQSGSDPCLADVDRDARPNRARREVDVGHDFRPNRSCHVRHFDRGSWADGVLDLGSWADGIRNRGSREDGILVRGLPADGMCDRGAWLGRVLRVVVGGRVLDS